MKLLILFALCVLHWPTLEATFTNPIKDSGPDPWMQYYKGMYYLVTTTFAKNVVMRRSKTLAGIHSAKDEVILTLPDGSGCCNMWAPEFHLLNGTNGERWYLYYAAMASGSDYSTQRIHVAESAALTPSGRTPSKQILKKPQMTLQWKSIPIF